MTKKPTFANSVVGDGIAERMVTFCNDALIVFDPERDEIIEANAKASLLLGYSRDELLDIPMSAVNPNEMPRLIAFARSSSPAGEGMVEELTCLTKQGEAVRSEISVASIDLGDRSGVIASIREITERKRVEEELSHQAFHDSLTGLANRQLFLDRLAVALARVERYSSPVAVLFFDLDRFKIVNDSYGHEAGDQVLQSLAKRVQGALRPSDTAARMGGDEFAILSEGIEDDSDAVAIAKRVSEAVSEPFPVLDDEVVLTASIGIVLSKGAGDQPNVMLRNADAAMYRAKEGGKARYELFDEGMRTRARVRLRSEDALRHALEAGQFRVFYQPEIEPESDKIVAVEALLRWEHPERGLLLPEEFLALAEETRLILPIGSWVLEEACAQVQRWRTLYPSVQSLVVAVNLSARQLGQSNLLDIVTRVLTSTGTAPSALCIEVTESDVMADIDSSIIVLRGLKNLGVSIAVDDFGKGHSSLTWLKRLPIDTLKIDQSFVQALGHDPADRAIVQAVITHGRGPGTTHNCRGCGNPPAAGPPEVHGMPPGTGLLPRSPCAELTRGRAARHERGIPILLDLGRRASVPKQPLLEAQTLGTSRFPRRAPKGIRSLTCLSSSAARAG